MNPERTPPRLARWLLERALPADVREHVCGDLEEVFQRRRRSHGTVRARFWFVKEALFLSGRFLWERIRERGRQLGGRGGTESTSGFTKGFLLRGGPWWLDFKLGLRMLVRYPGLTLVGGLAMSIAIGLGAAWFEIVNDFIHRPSLPLEDGDRIVGVQNWDVAAASPARRSLVDFVMWRDELGSVEDLGAYRSLSRNLITDDGQAEPVRGAEISSSAFRIVRTPPLLGRTLLESDEQDEADPVVVISHELWQRRFGGDPDIVGQAVRLGDSRRTVVGVMPKGFAFPVNHSVWVPLRTDISSRERGIGPAIRIFGRLAPHATLEGAQAELDAIGLRSARDFSETHQHCDLKISSGVVVTQVALTVFLLPSAIAAGWSAFQTQAVELGFPAEAYLSVKLTMDRETRSQPGYAGEAEFLERFRSTYRELYRRLEAEADVVSVAVATELPGMDHPERQIELDGPAATSDSESAYDVRTTSVDVGFFESLSVPILSGREFGSADLTSDHDVVIVNQSFVRRHLADRNPIGRRVRYAAPLDEELGPWYEIVGVVSDLVTNPFFPGEAAAVYHPLRPDPSVPREIYPVHMAVRVASDPSCSRPGCGPSPQPLSRPSDSRTPCPWIGSQSLRNGCGNSEHRYSSP